ncbi:MAG: lipocalin family protein [Silanimonas lenta]
MRRLHPSALVLLAALLLGACAHAPEPRPMPADAPPLDLPAFMGTWHVVAHVPYFFENGKVATRDVYALREDGRVENLFVFKRRFDGPDRTWRGLSSVVPGSGNREWKVRFVWPFSTRLQVLEVSEDGRTALLATPDRKLAWIFSREPVLEDGELEALARRLAGQGVDARALRRVPQQPGQEREPILR